MTCQINDSSKDNTDLDQMSRYMVHSFFINGHNSEAVSK